MYRDDNFRQEDLNRNHDPIGEELPGASPPSRGGGNRGSFRAYILVAALILIALFGFSRSTWAIPSLGRSSLGCCRSAAANSDKLSVETIPQENLGGCCGGSGIGAAGGDYEEELRQVGLQFYLDTSGDPDVEDLAAFVQDFGCHQEIFISKGDQLIMRVGYANGQAYEIPVTR